MWNCSGSKIIMNDDIICVKFIVMLSCKFPVPVLSFADRVNREAKAVGSICPSVPLLPLYLLNRITSKFEFSVWIMTIARLGLIVKVIGQSEDQCPARMFGVSQ